MRLHYEDEELTDNTKTNLCIQCKDCVYQSDGTVWSNKHDKACCMFYRYPNFKPVSVVKNLKKCEYYKKDCKET